MNENIIPVNNEALARALEAVVGAENAALVVKAYQVIDKAMADGFAQGAAAQAKASDESRQAYADNAFERGRKQGDEDQWEAGYGKGFHDGEETAYDDGYVDGVSDARLYPKEADARVALLISGDAFDPSEYTSEDCADWWNDTYVTPEDFFASLDAYNGDSGDENDAN